ncbi:MAG TPA: arginine--tRNA ligase [Chitinophagales bacterium]|nr:arginine--tRNA ligase [Chitinophagales bacterium]
MEQSLREKTAAIVDKLYGQKISPEQILVNIPPKEYSCDFTVVVFPIAKVAKKSPEETAKEIGSQLQNSIPEIVSFEAVKGFLNVTLSDQYWINFLSANSQDQSFAVLPATGKKVMIEYCGPNTNKPLHLGHLRNIFIGYSMSGILKAAGNEVVKVNIYNDRGVHICKSMVAYQKFGNHETPESSGKKGDHFIGDYYVRYDQELKKEVEELKAQGVPEEEAKKNAPLAQEVQAMLRKWEEGDAEVRSLWSMMNGWVLSGFEETYRILGVDFDKAYFESQTYQLGKTFVEEGLQKGIFFKKEDGSVWIDLTSDGLDQKLLLRADGTSVYITQDIGTANERWNDFHPDKMIYTVANEQDYHFKVLKLICSKLGKPYADGMYHLSYGMVDLPTGRMKSREGTVVDADDLVDEMISTSEKNTKELGKIDDFSSEEQKNLNRMLALGALKFFILKVDPKKRMIFNPEESIDFHGFTGPFIQYTHARIQSVMRKAGEPKAGQQAGPRVAMLQPQERELILRLQRFPAMIQEAASAYEPAVLANYIYHLAKAYNHFYQELPILNSQESSARDFRLQLSSFVASVIKKGMKLLGIEVPERM